MQPFLPSLSTFRSVFVPLVVVVLLSDGEDAELLAVS
jgi:hypothetical protein